MFGLFNKKRTPKRENEPKTQRHVEFVVRLKTRAFREYLASIDGVTADNVPITDDVIGELIVSYAMDVGEGYQFVDGARLAELGVSPEALRSQAMANTMMKLADVSIADVGGAHQLINPEGFAACSLLFPRLWQQLEREYGGELAAAFVDRDTVFFSRTDARDGMDTLRRVVEQTDFSQTHALSPQIYVFRDRGWVEFRTTA